MHAAEVRLENIGKRYGDQWVVRGVHLRIGRGEFYTFLGPSGCGKTTLLRMIAGFAVPDEGRVYLDEKAMNQVPPWERDVGMVFQNYALWPHFTVFENVAFGLRERKVPRREIEARVANALARVDLKGTEKRRPSQLSGGQQQRVALARTLVIQPRVLLLDEPLSNLDAKLRVEMRLELLKLQRDIGLTTIYVTHDQEEALALSTRIAVINNGKIVQEGKPREIYEQPADDFVAAFVGQSNLFAGAVRQIIDRSIEIDLGSLMVHVALPAAEAPPQSGAKVVFSIRPEAIELYGEGGGTPPDRNCIDGEVVASAYQGSSVEYEIMSLERTIKARTTNPKGMRLYQRGERVSVAFRPEDAVLVPENEDANKSPSFRSSAGKPTRLNDGQDRNDGGE
jgi:iron(III) transport system ATP-binding protein